MNEWFDIHSHILPSIDDGAVSLEKSRNMLKIAYEEGIATIFATPHYAVGAVNIEISELYKKQTLVNDVAKDIDPSIKVLLGNEIYYSEDVIRHLREGKALTLANTRYVLVEFSKYDSFEKIKTGIHRLLIYGYLPIISHVEDYPCLMDDLQNIEKLLDLGTYTQVNVSSLTGAIGDSNKKNSTTLIKNKMVHFLATNSHSDYKRGPYMKKGVRYLKRKFGDRLVDHLLIDNPKTLLKNEYIYN